MYHVRLMLAPAFDTRSGFDFVAIKFTQRYRFLTQTRQISIAPQKMNNEWKGNLNKKSSKTKKKNIKSNIKLAANFILL